MPKLAPRGFISAARLSVHIDSWNGLIRFFAKRASAGFSRREAASCCRSTVLPPGDGLVRSKIAGWTPKLMHCPAAGFIVAQCTGTWTSSPCAEVGCAFAGFSNRPLRFSYHGRAGSHSASRIAEGAWHVGFKKLDVKRSLVDGFRGDIACFGQFAERLFVD